MKKQLKKKFFSIFVTIVTVLSYMATIPVVATDTVVDGDISDAFESISGVSDPFYYDAESGELIEVEDNVSPAYFDDSYISISVPGYSNIQSGDVSTNAMIYSEEEFRLHGGFVSYSSSTKNLLGHIILIAQHRR